MRDLIKTFKHFLFNSNLFGFSFIHSAPVIPRSFHKNIPVSADHVKILPWIVHVFYFLMAFAFCYTYYITVVRPDAFDSVFSIKSVLTFSTILPFQYRLLVPLLFKFITSIVHIGYKPLFLIYSSVTVYLTIVIYRHVLIEYFRDSFRCTILAPTLLYPMLWNYSLLNNIYEYYDFTAILVFVAGMYFILKKRFFWLAVVFTVGLLNKESAVYLIFAYLFFHYDSLFKKETILKASLLVGIFLAIKISLYYIFRTNSGYVVDTSSVQMNIERVSDAILLIQKPCTKQLLLCFGGLYAIAILLVATKRWKIVMEKIEHRKLYMNFVIIPYMIFGFASIYYVEVRVYSELIPLFTTLFIAYISTFAELGFYKNDNVNS